MCNHYNYIHIYISFILAFIFFRVLKKYQAMRSRYQESGLSTKDWEARCGAKVLKPHRCEKVDRKISRFTAQKYAFVSYIYCALHFKSDICCMSSDIYPRQHIIFINYLYKIYLQNIYKCFYSLRLHKLRRFII